MPKNISILFHVEYETWLISDSITRINNSKAECGRVGYLNGNSGLFLTLAIQIGSVSDHVCTLAEINSTN